MVPENELARVQWGWRCPGHLSVACLGMSSQPHLALWSNSVEPGWEINRKVSQRESKHNLPARGLVRLYVQENPVCLALFNTQTRAPGKSRESWGPGAADVPQPLVTPGLRGCRLDTELGTPANLPLVSFGHLGYLLESLPCGFTLIHRILRSSPKPC